MRKLQPVPEPAGPAPASETRPAGGNSPAPGSLTLSNGLTLPPAARPVKALPGAFHMPADAYFALPAPGRSNLDKIRISPRHYQHCLRHPAPSTKAQTRGRAAHRIWLEPMQFWLETACWPEVFDPETDAGGSKTTGEGAVKRWKAFQAKHAGKDIVTERDVALFRELDELLRFHPQTKELLAGAVTEASLFFERGGVTCKMRADVLRPDLGLIVDLKTTYDLQEHLRSVEKYGGHRQAEFYLAGATEATGVPFHTFLQVVVQLPPEERPLSVPVDLAVVQIGADLVEDAREENDWNLHIYKRCVDTGSWPGFAPHMPLVVGRAPWRAK